MRRGLLILLGLLAVTWFEIEVYPGHSYLQGETQLLVPMLERLDTPGFLSRDLVASNPAFAYTIYDEITQLLHREGRSNFERALLAQQIFFRFAGILGVFLLARALKVTPLGAVVLSGVVNAITRLPAPHAFVTNPEATPVAYALPLVLLAGGLLAHRKPLLGSVAGGLALLYDPMTAAAFWLIIGVAWFADRSLRKLLRPAWLVLLIFALILGNLAQLQAGLGSGDDLTGKMSAAMVHLTQIRTPWTWVSVWMPHEMWSYAFLFVAGTWALAIIWRQTDRLARWVVIGLASSGLVSVGFALILLAARWQLSMAMPPARNLAFTVAISVLVCGAAGFNAAEKGKWGESLPWAALLIASVLNAQILDLLHLKLAVVPRRNDSAEVRALAKWAERTTWGGSMFQFADEGKLNDPGVFRALSRRPLWADWQSGVIVDYSDQAGQQWWSRWQANMAGSYSIEKLQSMLPLPIDYYVLRRNHELAEIKPVYSNSEYVVYDAEDLREAQDPLRQVKRPD